MSRARAREDAVATFARDLERAELSRRATIRAATVGSLVLLALALAVALAIARPGGSRPSTTLVASSSVTSSAPYSGDDEPAQVETPLLTPAQVPDVAEAEPPTITPPSEAIPEENPAGEPVVQRVTVKIGTYGYEPSVVEVTAGTPIELTVGRGDGCAAGFLVPDFGIAADNSSGPVTLQLSALQPGSYSFTCGMGMISGEIVAR